MHHPYNPELLQLFVEHTPAAVAVFDRDMRYLIASRRWLTDYGLGDKDIIGRSHYEVCPETPERWKQIHQWCMSGSVEKCEAEPWVRADGTTEWVKWEVHPWRHSWGEIGGIVIVTQFITEIKQAAVGIAHNEARNRALLQALPDMLFRLRSDGTFVDCQAPRNDSLAMMPSQFLGKKVEEVLPVELAKATLHNIERAIATGETQVYEYQIKGLDGNLHDCEARYAVSGEGEALVIVRDISERKRAERAQARLTAILEATTDLVGITDAQGSPLYINRAGRHMLGVGEDENIAALTISDFHPKSVAELILNEALPAAFKNGVWSGETALRHCSGREIATSQVIIAHKSESGDVEFISTVARDISERKQAEIALQKSEAQLREKAFKLEQILRELQQTQIHLIQSEKMSYLGQLVAGVAHEINNPVSFIYGNITPASEYAEDLLGLLRLYQEHYPDPTPEVQKEIAAIDLDFLMEDLPRVLSSIKVGAERICDIVLSLRNFSRLDGAMNKVDIHEGIDSTLMILRNRLKAQPSRPEIQVIKAYGNLPTIECYAGQLNQVFMNILTNAIDALEGFQELKVEEGLKVLAASFSGFPKGREGWKVDSSNQSSNLPPAKEQIPTEEQPATPFIRIRTELGDNNQVVIRIADNGPGMREEVRSRIFDPFFTTKPIGKGTGLGLSISYQIVVEKHCGQLHCISQQGQGTEFVIEIPLCQGECT